MHEVTTVDELADLLRDRNDPIRVVGGGWMRDERAEPHLVKLASMGGILRLDADDMTVTVASVAPSPRSARAPSSTVNAAPPRQAPGFAPARRPWPAGDAARHWPADV